MLYELYPALDNNITMRGTLDEAHREAARHAGKAGCSMSG